MKTIAIITASVSCILFSASCSSTGLTGKIPIPFTEPAMDAQGMIQVTPLPPKICIGVDVTPREEPEG